MNRVETSPPTVIRRGDATYEATRVASSFNKRPVQRYPAEIWRARTADDVVAAVRSAVARGLRVSVKSGGHSWSANHLRDDVVMIDVSGLDSVRIDGERRLAVAGPGAQGADLALQLAARGLFFPAGHCRGVRLGGYLLQGGFGWHSRTLGPATMSVTGVDVVTADGRLVHADETAHSDLYWAARGSGCGFFGVVVAYHLRLVELPRAIGAGLQLYRLEQLDEVTGWVDAISREVPDSVELQLVISRDATGRGTPGIGVFAPVFADSWRQAWHDLAFLRTRRSGRPRARLAAPMLPMSLDRLYSAVMAHYPDQHRYAVDNVWTGASAQQLAPALRVAVERMPAAPSHILWMNWAPPSSRPPMAFSMEDRTYLAFYGIWNDPALDGVAGTWAVESARSLEPLASGCQLADENLGQRPARFVGDEQLARLDRVRAAWDPDGRFVPWMGRP